jgi:hypothetical protein
MGGAMAGPFTSWVTAACILSLSFLWAPVGAAAAQDSQQDSQPLPAGDSGRGADAKTTIASPTGYYVEFRVARIGLYGHSYVAYGRLDARRQPADFHYADLHPMGNYAVMAIGHIVPVPANTEWDPDVLKLPVASSYRRNLNAAEYQKLLAAVQRARANKQPTWDAVSNNCNHFVAQLATAVGLRTPNDFQFSYSFIPALRELNDRGSQAEASPASRAPMVNRTPTSSEKKPRS